MSRLDSAEGCDDPRCHDTAPVFNLRAGRETPNNVRTGAVTMPSFARVARLVSLQALLALPLVAGVAIVGSHPAVAQETAQTGDIAGVAGEAIAVSRGGQRWGVGHAVGAERWNTLLRASQAAMRECGRYDCRVQFQSVNPSDRCVTFARGTRSYGLGVAATSDAARNQAMRSCALTTTGCHVVDARCS
jgi:hypothetical protein